MHSISLLPLAVSLAGTAVAQFPPAPEGTTVIPSTLWPGASVSYKETKLCETTPNVHSYAGYVNLPSTLLAPLETVPNNISTFFWFFESRKDPSNSPLAIWLGGGPGESALDGTITENGPCYVNDDSKSTTLNPWSLNNIANVVYIDQPSNTGFSYQNLINGTLNQLNGSLITPGTDGVEPGNMTLMAGTFPDQDLAVTVNSTDTAARILWHVVQELTADFDKYDTADKRLNLFTNSYGGYFGPATMDHFLQQNALLFDTTTANTTDPNCEPKPINTDPDDPLAGAHYLHLDTLGFTNGCVDLLSQALSWATFAVNNTYGLPIIDDATYTQAVQNITQPGGCQDLIQQCRLAAAADPLDFGANQNANDACVKASLCMLPIVLGDGISIGGRSVYDISQKSPSAFSPPVWSSAWFNSAEVQAALGVPLNWTVDGMVITSAFLYGTGDDARQDHSHLARVLDAGVKVAMVYGDLDHRCNWFGAENVSLTVPYASSPTFNAAGYTPISINSSSSPGVVRQHAGFSFSRVFQAGHAAGWYQPEAVYEIFARTMQDKDVATGAVAIDEEYATQGPASSLGFGNSTLPAQGPVQCSVWSIGTTCTPAQGEALVDGTAVVEGQIVVSPAA